MTREKFIELVGQEQKQLRRFLLVLCCGDLERANDIAQEALIKAYLSSGTFSDEGKFTSWIYKIAHNSFLDSVRKYDNLTELENAVPMMDATFEADRKYEYQDLYAAIATLQPKERTAILLFYMKGYSIKEIAKITDCSPDAVKKQLSRGRDELKLKIKR